MEYLKKPNLPSGPVSHVICGYHREIYTALQSLGVSAVNPGQSIRIHNITQMHADMLGTHLGAKYFMVDRENDTLKDALRNLGFNVVMAKKSLENEYPLDCPLNCVLLGNLLLCNTKTVDQSLLRYCTNNRYEIIHTEQGYTKCNTCIVNNEAIITSDLSIYTALKGKMDILPVEIGHIMLQGYPYGFIGGATGLIDRDKLAFAGDLTLHPSYERIRSFLQNHHVEPVSLLPGQTLTDVGSILPILQYEQK